MTVNGVDTRNGTLNQAVQLLRWPAQQDLREECRSQGTPRILVVESGSGAPICDDIYEDWVRAPVASHDLKARADALVYRYSRFHVPHLDENDVLRFAARSVVVSPMQAELLKLLLARFGEVVPREALRFRLGGKQTVSRNALDLHVMRLRQRVAPIGLTICTAWGRGYVLDIHKEGRA